MCQNSTDILLYLASTATSYPRTPKTKAGEDPPMTWRLKVTFHQPKVHIYTPPYNPPHQKCSSVPANCQKMCRLQDFPFQISLACFAFIYLYISLALNRISFILKIGRNRTGLMEARCEIKAGRGGVVLYHPCTTPLKTSKPPLASNADHNSGDPTRYCTLCFLHHEVAVLPITNIQPAILPRVPARSCYLEFLVSNPTG